MEQVLDWLNENELRAYPLLDNYSKTLLAGVGDFQLPDNFLLDQQLVIKTVSLRSRAIQGATQPVFLRQIRRNHDSSLEVIFSTSVLEVLVDLAVFNIASPSTKSYPLYIRNTDGNLAVFGLGVLAVCSQLPEDTYADTVIPVEPTTCLQFNDAWLGVSSIQTQPEKKSIPGSYEPLLPLQSAGSPTELVGNVQFLEGYNFRVNIANNLIDLTIGNGYGLRMNCAKHFIDPKYRDCGELVSYINGIPPDTDGSFRLLAGSNIAVVNGTILTNFNDNVRVQDLPEQHELANKHTIFVGLTFQTTDLCAPINLTPS